MKPIVSLNARQQRFVEEYMVDLNAKQAAIRAGYSERSAEVTASRLLSDAKVGEIVAIEKQSRAQRTAINADWVLRRLAEETDADLADLYDDDGHLRPIKQWPKIWRQGLVAGLETETEVQRGDDGDAPLVTTIRKVKLSDRVRRLELIGKHIGVGAFSEKHEHELKVSLEQLIAASLKSDDAASRS